MKVERIIELISRGRTDYIFHLLKKHNWKDLLHQGSIKPIQWLVYYNDTTALRTILESGGTLDSISLNDELGNAAFFSVWVCLPSNYEQPVRLVSNTKCILENRCLDFTYYSYCSSV